MRNSLQAENGGLHGVCLDEPVTSLVHLLVTCKTSRKLKAIIGKDPRQCPVAINFKDVKHNTLNMWFIGIKTVTAI